MTSFFWVLAGTVCANLPDALALHNLPMMSNTTKGWGSGEEVQSAMLHVYIAHFERYMYVNSNNRGRVGVFAHKNCNG